MAKSIRIPPSPTVRSGPKDNAQIRAAEIGNEIMDRRTASRSFGKAQLRRSIASCPDRPNVHQPGDQAETIRVLDEHVSIDSHICFSDGGDPPSGTRMCSGIPLAKAGPAGSR